jgi:hypothetical protein
MRTVTIKELVLEEFNKMLAKEGVQIVAERPRPQLATKEGEVVQLRGREEKE